MHARDLTRLWYRIRGLWLSQALLHVLYPKPTPRSPCARGSQSGGGRTGSGSSLPHTRRVAERRAVTARTARCHRAARAPSASGRRHGAAVVAARLTGGMRAVHVRRVTLLLAGETALRRARVRAAAAAAAANSGPIDTTGLL